MSAFLSRLCYTTALDVNWRVLGRDSFRQTAAGLGPTDSRLSLTKYSFLFFVVLKEKTQCLFWSDESSPAVLS